MLSGTVFEGEDEEEAPVDWRVGGELCGRRLGARGYGGGLRARGARDGDAEGCCKDQRQERAGWMDWEHVIFIIVAGGRSGGDEGQGWCEAIEAGSCVRWVAGPQSR